MNPTLIVFLVLIVTVAAIIILSGRKRKWYKVYLANNDVQLLYKKAYDWWFRESGQRVVFRRENGNIIVFPTRAHWILFFEEIEESEIDAVKAEIQAYKDAQVQ